MHHTTEFEITPTPEQAHALRQLRAACGTVALACAEQNKLQASGQDHSIASLLGGADHPVRTPLAEATELRKNGDVCDTPLTLLLNTIVSQRARGDHLVSAPVQLGGEDWLLGLSGSGVRLRGVPGIIPAQMVHIAHWAMVYPAPGTTPQPYQPTGSAWVTCERECWTLDIGVLCDEKQPWTQMD
ncbi:hypothetical protein [Deinococcus marmoris]|uniref:Uncharacterized protein n=1 Tax=Deinococcus marmoris TaxID=249408 RepID=A0A1U7NUU0_9DEIO|nr:hypothetical protein [Deinococcus marmoris]OLV16686.1 hypothetical protein BOO71_0011083 [Deinococcus marmoris]